jgi:LPS export ABC transporter protein LptC
MSSMKWYWLVLSGLALGGIGLLSIGKQGESARTRQTGTSQLMSQPQNADSQMQGIKLIEQADRATAWEILAERAEFSDHGNLAVAHGVRARLFQDDTALLSLEANRSIVHRDTGNITMQGGVRIIHQDGYTIMTKVLDWRAEGRQLHTDEAVELKGPSAHITGIGLQSEVDQQRFHLEHHVHASFRLR